MKSVFNAIVGGFGWVGDLLGAIIHAFWDAILGLLDIALATAIAVIGLLLDGLAILISKLVAVLTAAIPSYTQSSQQVDFSVYGMANQYVPLSEMIALLASLVVLGSIIGVIKIYKLIPGKAT